MSSLVIEPLSPDDSPPPSPPITIIYVSLDSNVDNEILPMPLTYKGRYPYISQCGILIDI